MMEHDKVPEPNHADDGARQAIGEDGSALEAAALRLRIDHLRASIRSSRTFRTFGRLIAIATPFIGSVGYLIARGDMDQGLAIGLGAIGYGLLFWLMAESRPIHDRELEMRELETRLELVETPVHPAERRAERLFRLHQEELERYYVQARRQSLWIFVVGVMSIAAGFAVVAITLAFTFRTNSSVDEKLPGVILGAASGVLANFVAVIYLRMYSETSRGLTSFHNRLVSTNHLHFANFLSSKIRTPNLSEVTLSRMAIGLATRAPEPEVKGDGPT